MKHTMLHMKLNSAVSVFAVAAAFSVLLPSSVLAGVCFLPDCQDEDVMNGGGGNMDLNDDTAFCESKGYTYYATGKCPQYYAEVGKCNRDDHYLKCDAQTWCKQNGYNTTKCSIPQYVDQPCPSYGSLYKGCKTDNDRACKETGFTKTCPSGQKLKKNSGRCTYDSSYGTCCKPSGCPSYTSLTSSSYGTNGTDGCEYTCYYTCNMNCPSGTSTSNPGGCGGSTRNGCGTKTCYYPYQSCCTPSCTNQSGCSCGTTTIPDGCGSTCTKCSACCSPSGNETNCPDGTVSCSDGCGGTRQCCKRYSCYARIIRSGGFCWQQGNGKWKFVYKTKKTCEYGSEVHEILTTSACYARNQQFDTKADCEAKGEYQPDAYLGTCQDAWTTDTGLTSADSGKCV